MAGEQVRDIERGVGGAMRRRRHRRVLLIAVAVVLMFCIATVRLFIWPPLEPLPARADAIIELAGSANGGRDEAALQLARDHRASVLVQSTTVSEAGTNRCLPAVPGVTVMCFHPDPATTRGEAEWIGARAAEHHWSSVILVTTPDQAVRAQLRVSRCFPGSIYVHTTALPFSEWFVQIPYQWAASVKALAFQRTC